MINMNLLAVVTPPSIYHLPLSSFIFPCLRRFSIFHHSLHFPVISTSHHPHHPVISTAIAQVSLLWHVILFTTSTNHHLHCHAYLLLLPPQSRISVTDMSVSPSSCLSISIIPIVPHLCRPHLCRCPCLLSPLSRVYAATGVIISCI